MNLFSANFFKMCSSEVFSIILIKVRQLRKVRICKFNDFNQILRAQTYIYIIQQNFYHLS